MIRNILINIFKVVIAVLIIGLGVFGYIWLKNSAPIVEVKQADEKIYTVDVSTVRISNFFPKSFSYGTIFSTREAILTFPIFGEISLISDDFKTGSFISKGSLLAKVDNFNQTNKLKDLNLQLDLNDLQINEINDELKADKSQLILLLEQLEIREKQKIRISNMVKNNASTDSYLDEVILALSNAKNSILSKKQNIVRLKYKLEQAKLSKKRLLVSISVAEKQLKDTVLRAPFDGALSSVSVAKGDLITSGKVLGRLTDLNALEVSFTVPSEIFIKSNSIIGKEIKIFWQQGTDIVSSIKAIISRRDPIVNPQEGGGKLYAELPDVDGALSSIPPGAFVKVEYPIGSLNNVIYLPEEALYEGNSVYIVIEERAEKRDVEVIFKEPGKVYVQGKLNDGDMIISTRLAGIGNGVRVKISK